VVDGLMAVLARGPQLIASSFLNMAATIPTHY